MLFRSVVPFHYAKTAQDKHNGKEDTSGNRDAYIKAGLKRGEHMSKLYGDMYERGYSDRGSGTKRTGKVKFRHKVKSFKVGVRAKNIQYLKNQLLSIFQKYATERPDKIKINITKPKFYVGIVDGSGDKFVTLSRILDIILKYDLKILNPQKDGVTYTISVDDRDLMDQAIKEFKSIDGLSILKGAK